jgi:alanine dehydrogenase
MGDEIKRDTLQKLFPKGRHETNPEMVAINPGSKKITVGIPVESTLQENRVSLVPNSVRYLTGHDVHVRVENGAGDKSNFSNHDYSESGAEVCYDKEMVFKSDIVLKVAPPTLEEIELLQPNNILISPLQMPVLDTDYLIKLRDKKVLAIAMEYMQAPDGSFPIVRIMSEIAGISAVHTAAELLCNVNQGRGVLLGGVAGVPPAKVVILGAGVVGEFATRAALGLGASVRIFDNDVHKLMRLQNRIGRPLHTSAINPVYLEYQLLSADVVIGAIHSKNGQAPLVVTEDMVSKMKPGSVIIDVSIDQGGCVETSRVTSHSKPTFIKYDVVHYCVPNIASKVARTASIAVSNIITPILLRTAGAQATENLLFDERGLRNGVYTYRGCVTNEFLAKRFGLKYTSLDLLLTSGL